MLSDFIDNRIMKFLFKRLRLDSKGQTMVEYLLLILIVTVIANSLFQKINEYLITNPDSFQNTYLNGYENIFSAGEGSGFQGRYKRFRVIR